MNPTDQSGMRFSRQTVIDPDAAFSQVARETDALAAMMGADSQRIDGLVQDVGEIRGDVKGLVKNTDELRSALAILVKHDAKIDEQNRTTNAVSAKLEAHDQRLQSIERRAPGWDEARAWVIRAGLLVLGLVGAALVGLVLTKGGA